MENNELKRLSEEFEDYLDFEEEYGFIIECEEEEEVVTLPEGSRVVAHKQKG